MRRPPPPPRPDFSAPESSSTASRIAKQDGAVEMSVTGSAMMNIPKLPPFLPSSSQQARRPNRGHGMWEIRNVALPMPATSIQPPFSPLPVHAVSDRALHRPPTAVMQRQEANAESRKMVHTAPELRQTKDLLQDLAKTLPKNLEGKKWYSELHKLKNKYDPRWHQIPSPHKDSRMKGSWTSLPIHREGGDPEEFGPYAKADAAEEEQTSPRRQKARRPGTGSTRSDRSSARNHNHRSNWNADGLAQVLQEKAKQMGPDTDVDPYMRALLVLEKPPKMRVGGYQPPKGRFERRYITAQYMQEYYNELDKSKQTRQRVRRKVRSGNNEDDEDVFARLEGDELTRAWAQARMNTLYQQAESKWDAENGHLVEERRARLLEQQEQQWRVKGLEDSVPANRLSTSTRTLDAPVEQLTRQGLFGKQVVDPEEVHALRQSMYKSIHEDVKDMSAPEYVYYEDPSYGAFDVLVGHPDSPREPATDKYMDPVAQETAQSRLRRVTLRNRGQALLASEQGAEVAEFLKGATGLSADNARQILVDRIGHRMAAQADEELSPTAAATGNAPSRLRPPHSEHLDRPKERLYGGTEVDKFTALYG